MRYQPLRVLFTLGIFLTLTISAFGQADVSSATIKGTVSDQQGAAVANATVKVKSVEQGTTRSVTTDSDGEFQILACGEVRLRGQRDRAFGQPLSFLDAFDPRRVQFGLKLAF
jgi:hypothetical protein